MIELAVNIGELAPYIDRTTTEIAMSSHRVILTVLVTADVEAGSPDEAQRIVEDALTDVKIRIGQADCQIGLDPNASPQVIGGGEDPAAD